MWCSANTWTLQLISFSEFVVGVMCPPGTSCAKCKKAKATAAGKKAADLSKAFGKNVKKPDAAKLGQAVSKAGSKFTKAVTTAENKGGCFTTGDTQTMEAKVDAFIDDIIAQIVGSPGGAFLDVTTGVLNRGGRYKRCAVPHRS